MCPASAKRHHHIAVIFLIVASVNFSLAQNSNMKIKNHLMTYNTQENVCGLLVGICRIIRNRKWREHEETFQKHSIIWSNHVNHFQIQWKGLLAISDQHSTTFLYHYSATYFHILRRIPLEHHRTRRWNLSNICTQGIDIKSVA